MKNLLFYLTLIGFSAISCGDRSQEQTYNQQLPAVTTTGANTFGCKINGVVMVPRNSIGYVPPGSNHYACDYLKGINYEYEHLSAGDFRQETKRGFIYIYLQNLNNTPTPIGTHNLYEGIIPNEFNQNYKDYLFLTINSKNYVSIEGTGSVNVLKSDGQIISGTFGCKAKNINDANDIINITEGRFDIDKNTINTTNFP